MWRMDQKGTEQRALRQLSKSSWGEGQDVDGAGCSGVDEGEQIQSIGTEGQGQVRSGSQWWALIFLTGGCKGHSLRWGTWRKCSFTPGLTPFEECLRVEAGVLVHFSTTSPYQVKFLIAKEFISLVSSCWRVSLYKVETQMPFEKGRRKREKSSNSRAFQRRLSTDGVQWQELELEWGTTDTTNPMKVPMEEHSDYNLPKADPVLTGTVPFLFSFLSEWVIYLLITSQM